MIPTRSLKEIARALITLAVADKVLTRVLQDLHACREVLLTSPQLFSDVSEIAIPYETRRSALEKSLKADVHPYTLNTLLLLQQRELLLHLSLFVSQVETLAEREANHYRVHVTSAFPLVPKERTQVHEMIEEHVSGTFDVVEQVEADLLGGVVLDIGHTRIDASVKGNLQRLKHILYV